jgi:putative DNA primase/helicase
VYTSQDTQTRDGFLVVRHEGILPVMKTYPSWVCWRLKKVPGKDKPTKVPYDALSGHRASHSDSRTWRSFEEAMLAYEADKAVHGIGFVFSSGDKLGGVDLDDCRDPESGALEPWAEQRLETARALGASCELSPSGTGVHLIGHCEKLVEGGNRKPLEVYTHWRFFTVTGWSV